ncbi:hypothetical protein K474DRAFT_1678809 [Panus rudis PR-1116 ss-1]|nr:hypothetical protein K474DRAFT_1678809 [Panus rudis PR-1116 ss-1]
MTIHPEPNALIWIVYSGRSLWCSVIQELCGGLQCRRHLQRRGPRWFNVIVIGIGILTMATTRTTAEEGEFQFPLERGSQEGRSNRKRSIKLAAEVNCRQLPNHASGSVHSTVISVLGFHHIESYVE